MLPILEVKIPKEIRSQKENIFFGLTTRQFVCGLLAVGMAAGSYLLFHKGMGQENASWICLLLAAPFAVAAFFRYNDLTLEQYVWAFIKTEFLLSAPRRFVARNLHYEAMNRKEADDFD